MRDGYASLRLQNVYTYSITVMLHGYRELLLDIPAPRADALVGEWQMVQSRRPGPMSNT